MSDRIDVARFVRLKRHQLSRFEQHWERHMMRGKGLLPDEYQTEETWDEQFEAWLANQPRY